MNMIIAVIISVLASGIIGLAAGYLMRAFFATGEIRRTKDAVSYTHLTLPTTPYV